MARRVRFPLRDIPKDLHNRCSELHWHYTVGFIRVEESNGVQDAKLLGSGVLVSAGRARAILTADHVLDVLPRSGRLGLVSSERPEKRTIDVTGTRYLRIDRGDDSGAGPDIGAVLLSESIASTLGARKSFYNLDTRRDELLSSPPDDLGSIWIVQGFVDELTKMNPIGSRHGRLKSFVQFSVIGTIGDYTSRGDHDYYTLPVASPTPEGVPNDFGGCSGGGLWRVHLVGTKGGGVDLKRSLLQGLAYWQDRPQNGPWALRGHGPRSIYDVAYSAIGQS